MTLLQRCSLAAASAALALALHLPSCWAQNIPVFQSGTALAHHAIKFTGSNGLMMDAGGLLGDVNGLGLKPFSITDPGLGLALRSAASGLAHSAFQLGFDGSGNALLQLSAEGGATSKTLKCSVNGIVSPCFGGNITGFPVAPTNTALKAATGPTVLRAGFAVQGDGGEALYNLSGSPCSLNSGNGDNGSQVKPDTGGGCWIADFSAGADVRAWGADPTGVADAAPMFRAALAVAGPSIPVIRAAGSYNLCSTVASPFADLGPPAIRVTGRSNFTLDLRGATLTPCATITTGNTGIEHILIDSSTDYTVIGGNFVGNMAGKLAGGDSIGITSFSDQRFKYIGQTFTGDWSSGGVPYDGDFLIDGVFSDARMYGVTFCFDFAFIKNVTFKDFYATGAFNGGPGAACFSEQYDVPSLAYNMTGVTIADSSHVTVSGGYATGFSTGWVVSSGTDYTFSNNHWYGNLGFAPSQPGVGGLIDYHNGGISTSVGHPPTQIIVSGDHYDGNGNATAGGQGILIANGSIANSDVITGIRINATLNNNSLQGIEATAAGTTHLTDVVLDVSCSGANQTACIGSNLDAIVSPKVLVSAGSAVSLTSGVIANITTLSLPAGVWDVTGQGGFIAAGTTVTSSFAANICNVSVTFCGLASQIVPNGIGATMALGTQRYDLATTTTIYLTMQASFTVSTNAGFGSLQARRVK